MVGARLGTYRIVRLLGQGGMGAVYEARDEASERRVAVKVLHPEHAREKATLARFFNEARAVNVIEHPSLVQISDFGEAEDGTAYLVMEYLEGETVSRRIERLGQLAVADALRITARLASALAAAHVRGVVHRDLKPGNVMMVPDPLNLDHERVKLLDFGIAKVSLSNNLITDPHTRTGLPMGTPVYMSPEQCRGAARVDAQADVYSLGVMLFEMLAGRPPFVAENVLAVLNAHTIAEPPPLKSLAPSVPDTVAALVHAMLRKDKDARPTMAQVAKFATAPDQFKGSEFTRLAMPTPGRQGAGFSTLAGGTGQILYRVPRRPILAAFGAGCALILFVVTLRSSRTPAPTDARPAVSPQGDIDISAPAKNPILRPPIGTTSSPSVDARSAPTLQPQASTSPAVSRKRNIAPAQRPKGKSATEKPTTPTAQPTNADRSNERKSINQKDFVD